MRKIIIGSCIVIIVLAASFLFISNKDKTWDSRRQELTSFIAKNAISANPKMGLSVANKLGLCIANEIITIVTTLDCSAEGDLIMALEDCLASKPGAKEMIQESFLPCALDAMNQPI